MATLKISSDLQNVIKKVVLDTYFPIGKLYLSVGNEDPNKTIGGTWTKISGYYLYADTSINNTNYTGKHTQSHTLTVDQMPSHSHDITVKADWGNAGNTNEENYNIGSKWDTNWRNRPWMNFASNTGGNQGHSHNIATKGIYVWQRTA